MKATVYFPNCRLYPFSVRCDIGLAFEDAKKLLGKRYADKSVRIVVKEGAFRADIDVTRTKCKRFERLPHVDGCNLDTGICSECVHGMLEEDDEYGIELGTYCKFRETDADNDNWCKVCGACE